jgi:N-acyl-D-amino-acid deacylase
MFDVIIRNARIVDGSGNPWFRGALAIEAGRVAAVGQIAENAETRETIDAGDQVVCPGFIDSHVHADLVLFAEPDFPGGVHQGVTTVIIGQDGVSYAPGSPSTQAFYRAYFGALNGNPKDVGEWRTVGEYLAQFDRRSAANAAYLVPHGNVRIEVMGLAERAPTADELKQMQAIVAQGMADGAIGVSTGLDYIPCNYSDTQELIEVCRPAGEAGGVYVTHQRSYGAKVVEATHESTAIGHEAKMAVHISHYNGFADTLLPLIEEGREQGVDVTFDTYPYLAGCTILSMVCLPRWVQVGGIEAAVERLRKPDVRTELRPWLEAQERGWDNLVMAAVNLPEHKPLEGQTIPQAAKSAGQNIPDFVCDLLVKENMEVAVIAFAGTGGRTESDMRRIMQHPAHMAGSDGIYTGGKPHPRGYGTFARYLSEYVREQKVLRLEEAIRHMTSAPAARFNLKDRGLLRAGFAADVVVFDPRNIRDRATYADGKQMATGVSHVFVNGEAVLKHGKSTGAHPGRGLKRG